MTTRQITTTTMVGSAIVATDTAGVAATVPSSSADAVQTPNVPAEVVVASADASSTGSTLGVAPQQAALTQPSLTIAGLYSMLVELGDAHIDAASLITPSDLSFVWSERGSTQKYAQGRTIGFKSLTSDALKGYNTISLSGTAVPAADLLAVLEPCLAEYGSARVCVRLRRATIDRPHALALVTDDIRFKDDPRSETETKAVADVIDFVKTMVEMRTIEPAKIAAAASALMPAGWSTTCYCADGVFFNSWKELKARLPRMYCEDTPSLFTTFAHEASGTGAERHGRFDLIASVPGITLAALTDAFGPKRHNGSKVQRLLAAVAAGAATNAPPS
ncbi:hypothetical protein TW95_gp1210 [Pandoravirus inopinatum]|uniref:Uncharacterized protein n=1 Tax=Pandoravirus inopinatum TaxID=1605721 RepID=A0A0B5J2Y0_9VIRU|nr:hypothetical protein TW95_gp1210 [Pandoravirus inopinatum]AJF97944.1 hypothetical protein [Pandoravirus inopinatum]